MPIDITTTVTAAAAGSTGINYSASYSAGAVDTISVDLAPSTTDEEVLIQPGPASAIEVLALYSDPIEPSVTYKTAPAAPAIRLLGAHVYNGPTMVALLGPNPTSLFFSNSGTDPRPVTILIGRNP